MDVREKLVELIGSTEYGNSSLVGKNFQKGFVEKIASNLIANGVTVQEWISVMEMEPEITGWFLTFGPQRKTAVVHFDSDGVWSDEDDYNIDVTHWMPLPQPPKGETIYCKDCEHLMFSDCYGECANGHKGIVNPNDTCEHAKRKPPKGE